MEVTLSKSKEAVFPMRLRSTSRSTLIIDPKTPAFPLSEPPRLQLSVYRLELSDDKPFEPLPFVTRWRFDQELTLFRKNSLNFLQNEYLGKRCQPAD